MRLEDIGFYTLSEERARSANETTSVKRLEVLITDRCNFRCPYCRGVKPELRGDIDVYDFCRYLDCLEGLVENVRFSGGEPTLHKDLPAMVHRAVLGGAKMVAVSTNGSASWGTYQGLIDEGVNDFSVSLDACCGAGFKKMSGGSNKWDEVRSNIEKLASAVYTTVGIVLDDGNERDVSGVISFAKSLGVADIRVIPSAQRSDRLSELSEVYGNHPILNYRIRNSSGGVSVRGMSRKDFHRCPLVLDDVAIAGGKHFPCIIYLREGGAEIGPVSSRMRTERKEWFRNHDVYNDQICKHNCLDVCREYNNHWRDYSLGGIQLPKMPTDSFSFSRWRDGAGDIKSLIGEWRFANLTSKKSSAIIKERAIGWTFGKYLSCRPKDEDVAVMWSVGSDMGWIHMMANELWEVYSG